MIATEPSSGLYFTLNGQVYLSGSTILITDVGSSIFSSANPRSSLVCATNNVNTRCCSARDGRPTGDWYFPNGSAVKNQFTPENRREDFVRSTYTLQVCLNRKDGDMMPIGVYRCVVGDYFNSDIIYSHM